MTNVLPSNAMRRFGGSPTRNNQSMNAFLTIKGDWGTDNGSSSSSSSSSSSINNDNNNKRTSTTSPCLGWTIDHDEDGNGNCASKRSNTNAYHVIGASRSGFYLSDDNFDNNHPRKCRGSVDSTSNININGKSDSDSDDSSATNNASRLVRCTRYGQRVKKPKSKHGHGHGNEVQ